MSRVSRAPPRKEKHTQAVLSVSISCDRLLFCPAESYDRCVVLIGASNNNYLCLEVPVSASERAAAAATEQEAPHILLLIPTAVCCLCCAAFAPMQDASYAQQDVEKLMAVAGCRKHSVYRDSDGMLW